MKEFSALTGEYTVEAITWVQQFEVVVFCVGSIGMLSYMPGLSQGQPPLTFFQNWGLIGSGTILLFTNAAITHVKLHAVVNMALAFC